MTKYFEYHKSLMQQALRIQGDIEGVKRVFAGIDDNYVKKETERLRELYAETMATLMQHLFFVTKNTIPEMEEVA